LEGALVSVLAQSTLIKKEITIELVADMLDKLLNTAKKEITIDEIKQTVCDFFALPYDKIVSKSRKREIVMVRQIAMYLSKNHTNYSTAQIGDQIGKKDHTTVLHSCKAIQNMIDTDKVFKKTMQDLEKKLLEY
jgi:chromosomal replication initiator protein